MKQLRKDIAESLIKTLSRNTDDRMLTEKERQDYEDMAISIYQHVKKFHALINHQEFLIMEAICRYINRQHPRIGNISVKDRKQAFMELPEAQ